MQRRRIGEVRKISQRSKLSQGLVSFVPVHKGKLYSPNDSWDPMVWDPEISPTMKMMQAILDRDARQAAEAAAKSEGQVGPVEGVEATGGVVEGRTPEDGGGG